MPHILNPRNPNHANPTHEHLHATAVQLWKTILTSHGYSPDQTSHLAGNIPVVIEVHTGLRYATTVALAGHGAHVFLVCRNREKAKAAIDRAQQEIKEKSPRIRSEPKLGFLELDLDDINKSKTGRRVILETTTTASIFRSITRARSDPSP